MVQWLMPQVAQWYNSRWAVELRAEYKSCGAMWPWQLKLQCDPDVIDVFSNTALHYATRGEHLDVVRLLLAAGDYIGYSTGVMTETYRAKFIELNLHLSRF